MTREKLIDGIGKIAHDCGFRFHTGFEHYIPHEIKHFPALWLHPPKLLKTTGRREGIRYYDTEIALMSLPASHEPQAKTDELARLEKTAVRMCLMLGANKWVRAVTDARYIPAKSPLTAAGEVSMTLRMKVQVPFRYAPEACATETCTPEDEN